MRAVLGERCAAGGLSAPSDRQQSRPRQEAFSVAMSTVHSTGLFLHQLLERIDGVRCSRCRRRSQSHCRPEEV